MNPTVMIIVILFVNLIVVMFMNLIVILFVNVVRYNKLSREAFDLGQQGLTFHTCTVSVLQMLARMKKPERLQGSTSNMHCL